MAALIRRLRKSEQGAEVIEMVLVLPLLLGLLFGLVDFGFLFQQYVVMTNAAAEGARVASLPGYGAGDVTARVADYATNGGVKGAVNTVTTPVVLVGPGGTSWPGSQVTVTHVYTYQFIGPLAALLGGSMGPNVTLTARSTVRHQVAAAP